MKRVIRNRRVSLSLRVLFYGSLALWVILFATGWVSTRLQFGPTVEGKSLCAWDNDLSGESSPDIVNLAQENSAAMALRRHCADVLPTVLQWAHRRESPSTQVFFLTTSLFLDKVSPYEYGEGAHQYRGRAARILGALGQLDPHVLPTLQQIRDDPNNTPYERQIAEESIARVADGTSHNR
jgi:hypothetical protein